MYNMYRHKCYRTKLNDVDERGEYIQANNSFTSDNVRKKKKNITLQETRVHHTSQNGIFTII